MKVKGEEFIIGNQSSHVMPQFYSEREKEPEVTTSEIEIEVKVKEISFELYGMREKSGKRNQKDQK